MKLSDYVINFLVSKGVTHIFEVAGGSIAHLLDSLYERKDIIPISMHHESAASFAAEGYSRASGNIGVAMATSGPGATNLITGIGSSFFDSIPCIFITGQVNTYEFKFNKNVRQIGFQETDIAAIVKPIVKESVIISDPDQIKFYLEKAFYLAKSGRPGPVLLDIPLNIQRAEVNPDNLKSFNKNFNENNFYNVNDKVIRKVASLIMKSKRPVILIGGGLRLANAQKELLELINKTGIPVVCSMLGLDSFPHNEDSFAGMIGTYGNRYANLTLANCDLLIALGTRLDTRQTGTMSDTFARGAKIIHVDIDKNELNNKVKADLALNYDVKAFLSRLNDNLDDFNKDNIKEWLTVIRKYKGKYLSYKEPDGIKKIDPNYFVHKLSGFLPENTVVCVDVGQNQIWSSQSLEILSSQRMLTQGGMGSMGSALAMAIGASFVDRSKTIVVITGDGGFQLNIQELQTIYHHNLNIKIILLNNHCYGMVRQFQEQYMDSRCQSTVLGYSCPDFQDVVKAYKIETNKICNNIEIAISLEQLFKNNSPGFLEVEIESNYKALPKLSVGRPIEDQEPLLTREELKSEMLIDPL